MKNQKLTPPYYAAIFTIQLSENLENFEATSDSINQLVMEQEGYLGADEMFDEKSRKIISVCYWKDLESIKKWRNNLEHQLAIKYGKEKWFSSYQIQIAKVEHVMGN